jgi:hypothetical protein
MSISIEDRVLLLEAKVAKLEAGKPAAAAPSGGDGDALPDHMLSKSWANVRIRKDPKRWDGASCEGMLMSEAPPEWHDCNASFLDWKAAKGREETPVRVNNKGKPWHEADTFNAKLSRAWAKRLRAHPPAPKPPPSEPTNGYGDQGGDDEIPF